MIVVRTRPNAKNVLHIVDDRDGPTLCGARSNHMNVVSSRYPGIWCDRCLHLGTEMDMAQAQDQADHSPEVGQ